MVDGAHHRYGHSVIDLARDAMDRSIGPGGLAIIRENAAAKAVYDCAIRALMETFRGHTGNEVVVVMNHKAARAAGFDGQIHPLRPEVRAWWPGLGEQPLLSRAIQRVTIATPIPLRREIEALLRAKQQPFGDAAIWMEL